MLVSHELYSFNIRNTFTVHITPLMDVPFPHHLEGVVGAACSRAKRCGLSSISTYPRVALKMRECSSTYFKKELAACTSTFDT